WKAFAYFRPFTKVSARPGMRGRPAQAVTPQYSRKEEIRFFHHTKIKSLPQLEGQASIKLRL
ncbi:MAG: hypothetical protein ACLUDH_15545, partial [Faecalispora sporosphaeroides]|uniref:hypothetical protein n=1 Tax=Faecalispora sporosphaeroides TaxID=1549 RepID=UPI0039934FA0